ncbi:thioredoxin family protein [Candidatus Peregrinibacteria bacterium]|nr:MAG: thioredoxin family protein [Candidatus Peregrinibacteria bacterium]
MALLESLVLPLGTTLIDFNLPGTDGKMHSPSDYADKKVLGVMFICNHCPYVKAVFDRLIQIQNDYADKGVQLIGINSNDANEYPDDSIENMKLEVQNRQISFPYLQDESQEVGKAYQAQCTPDIYVFDAERKLAYHGRIDDNWQEPEKVTRHELREALDHLLAGEPAQADQKPTMGCSIKWKS